MRVLERAVYLGPNLWADFHVIRLLVDLGPLEEWPSGRLGATFQDGLLTALPGLREHGCSYAEEGGFVRRLTLDEGTWLGHVLEHAALELQNVAGSKVTFGKTRTAGRPGQYQVVYEYQDENVGFAAGELALTLLLSLLPQHLRPPDSVPTGFEFGEARDAFIAYAQEHALGPSTRALVEAAEARDIPWLRLDEFNLVQFGHGKFQQRIQASVTSNTRHIAVEIAGDKELTNRILADLGIPVARQRLVRSADDAVTAAHAIGYPVVVKPLNANHGRGVSIELVDDPSVRAAFVLAAEHSRSVLVESFVVGDDHRLLVVAGRMIAAARRVPGHVVGDGVHPVAQLVEIENRDPRRGIGHEKILTRIDLDPQADRLLAARGYDRASVPPRGDLVFLRATGNLSTGGTATDVTDIVHPDNVAMAERAAQAIGLDVCGVDFLTTDITQSYQLTGGAICELNAAPGLRMHVAPSTGSARDVAGPILETLFPGGTPSRIPIAAITGTNGKTTTARMVAHVLKMAGRIVGLTTTDGVYIGSRLALEGDMTGPIAARMVLRDPTVDVAVLETARGGLLRRGMGFRWSDVAACINVHGDHLGSHGVDTIDQLAKVKRIVVETARDTVVLNADDVHCLKMAARSNANNLCYVTMDPSHALVKAHISAGGRALVLERGMVGQMITLYDKGAHIPLMWVHEIPATFDGRALHNVENAMFAAAIAHGMGTPIDEIRHGLRTFDSSFFQAPGRTNIYSELPFKVVLDYGHNPAAVRAIVDLCDRLEVRGRRLCVLSAPGDRRDLDIREVGRACAGHFDHYVCRHDDDLRGRRPREVPELLRDALLLAGVPEDRVEIVATEEHAVSHTLRLARPHDLLLILGDDVRRCWQQITGFRPDARLRAAEPTVMLPPARRATTRTMPPGVGIAVRSQELVRTLRGVHLPLAPDEGADD